MRFCFRMTEKPTGSLMFDMRRRQKPDRRAHAAAALLFVSELGCRVSAASLSMPQRDALAEARRCCRCLMPPPPPPPAICLFSLPLLLSFFCRRRFSHGAFFVCRYLLPCRRFISAEQRFRETFITGAAVEMNTLNMRSLHGESHTHCHFHYRQSF